MIISMVGVAFLIFGLGLVVGYFVGMTIALVAATNIEGGKTYDKIREIRTQKMIKKVRDAIDETENEEGE